MKKKEEKMLKSLNHTHTHSPDRYLYITNFKTADEYLQDKVKYFTMKEVTPLIKANGNEFKQRHKRAKRTFPFLYQARTHRQQTHRKKRDRINFSSDSFPVPEFSISFHITNFAFPTLIDVRNWN
jgi:hypothetical protein